jgi:hypothetical protein
MRTGIKSNQDGLGLAKGALVWGKHITLLRKTTVYKSCDDISRLPIFSPLVHEQYTDLRLSHPAQPSMYPPFNFYTKSTQATENAECQAGLSQTIQLQSVGVEGSDGQATGK